MLTQDHINAHRSQTENVDRLLSPEEILQRYQALVDPVFGPAYRLDLVAHTEGWYFYSAAYYSTSRQNIRLSIGKGRSPIAAQANALCEVLERYSSQYQGNEQTLMTSYLALGPAAIHPHRCVLFSEAQYQNRLTWNAQAELAHQIPEKFQENGQVAWSPVWSMTHKIWRYLPTSYLYSGTPQALDPKRYCFASSNGNAAGATLEEATLQGLLELVERDAVAIWWYNRLQHPAIYLEETSCWVLDLTTDLNIPVFAALSLHENDPQPWISMGFGCHLDAHLALSRAISEMHQLSQIACINSHFKQWFTQLAQKKSSYLYPQKDCFRNLEDFPKAPGETLSDLQHCQTIVENAGMEVLVLDQTREEIGLPVVKVVVPGLRHFWPRFAPGRLYDLPVKMGWLTQAYSEAELNPLPMIL